MSDLAIAIDEPSLLVGVVGTTTLSALEAALKARGLTLGVALERASTKTVADWLASGAVGSASVFADPADHLVAGLEATLPDGSKLVVRPSPRRSVGPDLIALALGTCGRLANVDYAWLRIHVKSAARPAFPLPGGRDLDPPLTEQENRLVELFASELRSGRPS